ncbi:MAG TPA: hypothetical protein VH639_03070 [Bryobacteraceae bacterium]|jgi:hypothetical protein
MQPAANPTSEQETAIIQIDVMREGPKSALLSGTFHQPPPLVRVKKNTLVKWQLNRIHPNDTFVVSFPNGSPFLKVTAVSDRTEPLQAVREGSFHYQVFVADGGTGVVYAIHNCPEFEVDGN